jgi:hypothetical protein
MGQLTNLYVSQSFQGLLKMTDSTNGLTSTLQTVQTGDGDNSPLQMSLTAINISGSFTVNGSPITGSAVDTGSFATTGSNVFVGDQTITGSLYSTDIIGTGSLFLKPNQSDARFVEVYNTSPTDTHITASGGQIFLGNDVTYVKVDNYGSVKRIDIVAENDINVSGSMSVTGSIDITGQYLVNGVAFSGGTSGTSGTSGQDGSSGTSGTSGGTGSSGTSGTSGQDGSSGTSGTSGGTGSSGTSGTSGVAGSSGTSGQDGSSGTSGTSGTSGVSPSLVGVITTGSITTSQSITGSLNLPDVIISGSLIGGVVNNGIIDIFSEAFNSGSVKLNISSSNAISQSNVIFGGATGPAAANQTGSIVISGSNNIILAGTRANTLVTAGTYGYLGGNGNIGNTIPTLGTGSLLRPSINNNALQSSLALQFTTSSLAAPTIISNLIYGSTAINHQSSSVSFQLNYVGGQGFTSNANTTTSGLNPSILYNIIAGVTFPHVTLNHNSSSITYQGNIGGGMTVTNNYTSSVSTAVNNATVTGNILGGQSNTLVISGSNTSNRRTFDSNVVIGRSNIINSDHSGSSAGHLVSTALLGDNLIVSASHTSTTAGGTVIVGRFNATGSLQESSQDAVFVVGTGTAAGNRRNAIHVDNTNNTRITGSVSITGSLSLNGVSITGGSGTSGTSGTSGVAGSSGTSGVAGSSGTSGTSGLAGSSGTSGTSGTLTLAGTTDNGVITLNGSAPNATVESNMTFDGSTLSVVGVTVITGSLGSSDRTFVIRSGSMRLSNESGSVRIADGNNQPQLFFNPTRKVGFFLGQSNMDQTDTQFGITSGSTDNYTMGGNFNNFRTGSNNLMLGINNISIKSGSNNVILAKATSYTTGSNNLILGTIQSLDEVQNYFNLQLPNSSDPIMFKSGSAPLTITGSFAVTGNVLFASGSDKTMGTFVLNGGNPGTATVSNSLVSATSLIFLTKQTNVHSGNGTVSITSKGTGTFNVTSNHNGDTDTVAYLIINPS